MCLLKHYTLLSFVYEYRHNLRLSNKTSDKIFNKLEYLESTLFFEFFKNVKEKEPKNEDYLYSLLVRNKNSITYTSYYTKWDYDLSKEVVLKPKLETETETELIKILELSEK